MTTYRAPTDTLGSVISRPRRGARVRAVVSRKVTNLPIRVPTTEWPRIAVGQKRMFRTYSDAPDRSLPVVPPETECPRPCLLFAVRHLGPRHSKQWEAIPGVLLSHRQEPLGAISAEDIEREGFDRLAPFRWHWQKRYLKLGWRPWDMVSVLEVKPLDFDACEVEDMAHWLFVQLFGDFVEHLP